MNTNAMRTLILVALALGFFVGRKTLAAKYLSSGR